MLQNKNCKKSCNSVFLPIKSSGKERFRDIENSIINSENRKNLFLDKKNVKTKYFSEPNVHEKSINISKLRNILTEAISNVTKENTLKKGESVELTLEIELLNTELNTPTNSLLEVTVLQHNKNDYEDKRKPIQIIHNKMTYKDEIKCSSSESVYLKHKNWFRNVGKFNDKNTPTHKNKRRDFTEEEIMYSDVGNKYMKTDCNYRKNIVTFLPDELLKNGYFKRSYSTITQHENSSDGFSMYRTKPRYTTTIATDNSLIKKLSNLFLSKKNEQFIGASTDNEIKALKHGSNNIIHESEKHMATITSKEGKKANINNLKNLERNMTEHDYVDMIEYSDREDQSKPKKSFFEHNIIKNKIHKKMSTNTKAVKHITASYSDTCIVCHTKKIFNLCPNNSNSIDFHQSLKQAKHFKNNNIKDTSQDYINKIESKKSLQQSQTKNGRGDAIDHYKQSKNKYKEQCKPFHRNKSTIFWDGKTIEINKQIKKKIEMLVLNELQNIALQEGMECEVTPLTSTEESLNSIKKVEKMTSYMCELDIKDENIRKSMKKRKILDRKYKTKHDREKMRKFKQIKRKSMFESSNRNQPIVKFLDNTDSELFHSKPFDERYHKGRLLNLNNKSNDTETFSEITYLQYSSSEYYNFDFDSETKVKPIQSNNVNFERQNSSTERFISKGFVKKIPSDDSTWYAYLSGKNVSKEISQECKTEIYSNKGEYSSVTSKECKNKIEIELRTQDLEFILQEARDKHKASKIFIYKVCKNCINGKHKKLKGFTGKNSNSYTNLCLTKASKKLKKYAK